MEPRLRDGLPAAAILVFLALLLPSSDCKLPPKKPVPYNRPPLFSERLNSEYEELLRTKREILNHTITDRHIFFVDLRNKSHASPRPSPAAPSEKETKEVVMQAFKSRSHPAHDTFSGKLTRQIEALKRTRVYLYVLVRVKFPDGLTMHARFHPVKETIQDVMDVVRSQLRPEFKDSEFEFRVFHKKGVLTPDTSFREARVTPPASTIILTWLSPETKDCSTRDILQENLTFCSDDEVAEQFPVGISLDQRSQKAKQIQPQQPTSKVEKLSKFIKP